MSIRSPDSTLIADYKLDCGDGIYYVYLNNNINIPEEHIPILEEELTANLQEAIKFERYLKKEYNISASLKVVKKNTNEIFIIDEDEIEDFTNIFERIKKKFLILCEEKIINKRKKDKKDYYIFMFFIFLFLTGFVSFPSHQKDIIERGEQLIKNERIVNNPHPYFVEIP